MDQTIASEKIQIERKTFFFDLKENQRGILLRVTEEVRGHRDTIIIPATGLKEVHDILGRMLAVIDEEGLDPTDPLAYEEDENNPAYEDDEDGEDGEDEEILDDEEDY